MKGVFPFALDDVLLVHVLLAIPVALTLASLTLRHANVRNFRLLGGLLFVASMLLIAVAMTGQGFAWRIAIAVSTLTGAALVFAKRFNRLLREKFLAELDMRTALLIVIVFPAAAFTYESARCRQDLFRLADLLEQSRLGDAQAIAHRLLILQPLAELRGKPVTQLGAEINSVTSELEVRVRQPLSATATSAAKIERARELAMLGRNSDALDVLSSMPDLVTSPAACNLCGTIGETEHAWQDAATWYRRARDNCLADPTAAGSKAELHRALMGLAYCQRKQADYAAAEQTYLQLLAHAPTADTCFLLANFYEDVQQATKAKSFAKRAMSLAPDRYQTEGQRLIDKLVTLHFGCLQAYAGR
jgi:tetratricopeptide (TPR) repeat protein